MRFALSFAAAALCGCASTAVQTPVNAPATGRIVEQAPPDVGRDVIFLSFSGGGARAASFSLGVLQQMRDTPARENGDLLDHVALITSVSGGSITAAYYGLHGPDGLDSFRAAYLDREWSGFHHTIISPLNWLRVYRGGMNSAESLAGALDADIFAGARMSDLHGPQIWINAAELHTETPFAFTPGYFEALCSDPGSVRVADAVAASMSVPLGFHPVTLESYADACREPLPRWVDDALADRAAPEMLRTTALAFKAYRDPTRMRYLNLVDGGILDNFGLTSLNVMRRAAPTPYAPLGEREAAHLRRLLVLVVNAERTSPHDWPLDARGPSGGDTLGSSLDAWVDFSKRAAYDAFTATYQEWREDLVKWRCGLPPAEQQRLAIEPGWRCDDVSFTIDILSFADLDEAAYGKLSVAPTAVRLDKDLIDALIEGGREALRRNPAAQALAR
ncbi:MAG TPA: patatin-like phospholipase family protein [Caulobacterales bacterium]|nr:patatin-like phospholipase family protein [Caulobacterales bacterium]